LPDPDGPVVLVHGDAGPGNFLFEHGHLTAVIDWELAHLGDPMEDLAWFSMRSVMEPVPDFAESLADYERFAGAPIDRSRLLYHRVFVSARVVVIRHRNVTGEPAHAIVSRALNRRLLVEALADASGTAVPRPEPIAGRDT
jgi:aminoglycoside phosphotransferase (APT) family kinase protein